MALKPPLRRWLRFNAVGIAGAAIQLTLLWLLVSMGVHPVPAAALAVEGAVAHNFVWHQWWTWAERRRTGGVIRRFARFNLSNGAISVAGNALMMWIFADKLGLPYLFVNIGAIAACSGLNYLVSDQLVFRVMDPAGDSRLPSTEHRNSIRVGP